MGSSWKGMTIIQMGDRLGEGAIKIVYPVAVETIDGKIKPRALALLKEHFQNSSIQRMFVDDYLISRNLRAAHVPYILPQELLPFKDVSLGVTRLGILSPICNGATLGKYFLKCQDTRTRLGLIVQLASSLEGIHGHNMAYLDLKPENVLVNASPDPRIKLGDFGLTRPLGKEVIGFGTYPDPQMYERSLSGLTAHSRTDSWVIGDLLHIALFGTSILDSNRLGAFHELPEQQFHYRASELSQSFSQDHYPLNELTSLIAKCFSHSREDRPSMTEIGAVLRKWLG